MKKITLFSSALLIMCLSIPVLSYAANFTGTYEGRFTGGLVGGFAVYVKPGNTSVFLAYNKTTNNGFSSQRIRIRANGRFAANNVDKAGGKVFGRIFPSGRISGFYIAKGKKGKFVGRRLTKGGSYYAGIMRTKPGICRGIKASGFIHGIVATNGKSFFYDQITRTNKPKLIPVGSKEGAFLRVTGKTVRGVSLTRTRFNGRVTGKVISGTWANPAKKCSGTFRMLQKSAAKPKPKPKPKPTIITCNLVGKVCTSRGKLNITGPGTKITGRSFLAAGGRVTGKSPIPGNAMVWQMKTTPPSVTSIAVTKPAAAKGYFITLIVNTLNLTAVPPTLSFSTFTSAGTIPNVVEKPNRTVTFKNVVLRETTTGTTVNINGLLGF